MTEICAPIASTGHITCNVISQRVLDGTTQKDMAIRVGQAMRSEEKLRQASEVTPPWMRVDEGPVCRPRTTPPTPQPPAVGDGRLVQMALARRAAADAALGPRADMPRPLIKLRGRTPQTPAAEESLEWGREARDLDQRALARVLHELQGRLSKETKLRADAEAKLSRKLSRSRSETPLLPGASRTMASSCFADIAPNTKALAMSMARGQGWYYPNSAGSRPRDRMTEMLEQMPPYQRPKRTRPLSASGCPYATMAEV
eukprot:gb/GFBE01030219.1/.p1 GENE.gb/GFBE01030219.1/~~gb/GFBE01030219.1/.p1  ORF type:complete len:258 (+),score=23.84 gb/GFBE01030219.1/:1-774(+)